MPHEKHLLASLYPDISKNTTWWFELGMPGSTKTSTGKVVFELIATRDAKHRDVSIAYLEMSKVIDAEIKSGSSLGQRLIEENEKMQAGALASDAPVMETLAKKVRKCYESGIQTFFADGCVRTINQGQSVVNAQLKWNLMYFDTPEAVSLERIRRRAIKEGRLDDAKPETVKKRLGEYRDQTFPVLGFFQGIAAKRVHTINAQCEFRKRVKMYLEYMGFSPEEVRVMLINLHLEGHPAHVIMMEALREAPHAAHAEHSVNGHDAHQQARIHSAATAIPHPAAFASS